MRPAEGTTRIRGMRKNGGRPRGLDGPGGGSAGRACAPAAERRPHLRRRPGLRRRRLLTARRASARRTSTAWPREGVRFTDFYVAQAVCSASRAALLTGCYPNRVGIHGALRPDVEDRHRRRRDDARRGAEGAAATPPRSTASGTSATTRRSCRRGTASTTTSACPTRTTCGRTTRSRPSLPAAAALLDGDAVAHASTPTSRSSPREYTERAVAFIEAHQERPFFLYLPHTMPHVPLFASEQLRGQARSAGSTAT